MGAGRGLENGMSGAGIPPFDISNGLGGMHLVAPVLPSSVPDQGRIGTGMRGGERPCEDLDGRAALEW